MKNSILQTQSFSNKVKTYILGFIFSLLLTVIPFFLVLKRIFTIHNTFIILIVCACMQIIIQIKYFLHLTYSKENYWTIFFLLFAMIIIFIIIGGSTWIMYNLNHHGMLYKY